MGFFSGRRSTTTTNRVDIPSWLQPFVDQGFGTAGGALSGLSSLLGGATADDLVAGFTPDQLAAFGMARDFATGASPFLPTAQNTMLRAAGGLPVESFLPAGTLEGLSGFGSLESFLPPAAIAALTGAAGGGAISPDALSMLTRGAMTSAIPVEATDAAGRILDAELIPGATTDALRRTAAGDFLMGGPGFDAAVEAAVRSATPGILSTFGRSVGGGTGGLAQHAIGQSAIDAFASQFGVERGRQLSAASELANLGLAGNQQRLAAAGLLGDLGLSGRAQQLGAAESLANLGLADQELRLAGGTALAGVAGDERSRALSAGTTRAGLLAELANAERSRQLQAAGQLPTLGLLGSDVLSQIGAQQQGMNQLMIDAPINAQQMLMQAALSGIPMMQPFLGSTSTTMQRTDPSTLSKLMSLASLAGSFFTGGATSALGGLGAGGGFLPMGGMQSVLSGGGVMNA
jgi:hypothetical protein